MVVQDPVEGEQGLSSSCQSSSGLRVHLVAMPLEEGKCKGHHALGFVALQVESRAVASAEHLD
eukprot:7080620-Alexandrium_andersonii.AAC.1